MAKLKSMKIGRTSNPALSQKVFNQAAEQMTDGEAMTISGTVNKSALLLLLIILSAGFVWAKFIGTQEFSQIAPYTLIGALGGLIVALIIIFKKTSAPYLAPIYAILEGVFIGAISVVFEMRFPGIVIQAVTLTFGTLFALLLAYKSGLIKVTENFKMGVVAATGSIFLIYLATFILGFFNINIPFIHGSGTIGIIFSIVVVIIAALNLVLDFDFIESGAEKGAPKFMEWYAAFGLIVTLVWLYLEILRLLGKARK